MRQAITALLLAGTLLSGRAFAQSNMRPMLGAPDDTAPVRTPHYGIGVQTNGFGRYRKNKTRAALAWLEANGYAALTDEFRDVAMNAPAMLDVIDQAWATAVADYAACGFTKAATLDPRRIFLTIEAAPFTDPYFGSMMLADVLNGDNGRLVVVHVNTAGYLQHYRNLSAWLLHNRLWLEEFGELKGQEDETRAQRPCGR